jgi:hypothetical protein
MRTNSCSARARIVLLSAIASVCGCAGNGPASQSGGSAFDQLQVNIFNQHCLSAGCHNTQAQAGSMDLTAGLSYEQLVNVAPSNPAALGAGLKRVVPFDPNSSFLLVKLTGPGAGEGSQMPQGMDPLSPSDIDAIRSWILAGAPRGDMPQATATPTPPPTATPSDTPTPPDTATPSDTATPAPTVTGTPPSTSTVTPTASPSPSPTATPTLSAFDQIQQTIFNTTCTDAFCHDAQGQMGGLVLVAGRSYANLVGVVPQNAAAAAAGLLRVTPNDPDKSFLVIKVAGPPPLEGLQMPLGKMPLSAAQMQLIRDWISAGAAP